MQRRELNCKGAVSALAALLLLAIGPSSGRAGAPLAKPDPPKALPKDIVTAWKEAGAEVGWLQEYKLGFLEFVREEEGKPGDLPAFRFKDWLDGRLAKLPAPAAAFGLDLARTKVTDAGLKELAALTNLQALYLAHTQVTDAGLKHLAALTNLQQLALYRTQVTEAGVKGLRKALPGCTIIR